MSYTGAGGDAATLSLLSEVGTMHAIGEGSSRCLAGVHPERPTIGAIGDWVGDDSVREAAEDWLRDQGCTVARGPMQLCSWFRYRANLGPHDTPPFLMEPVEPPERWLAAGYTECARYTSTLMPHGPIITHTQTVASRLASEGWSIETLPRGEDGLVPLNVFTETVAILHEIAHDAFSDAFGFVSIPLSAMQALYAPYRAVVDPDLVFIAKDPGGTPAGFVFGVPDRAQPERRWAVIKTSAIRTEHRGKRVGTWLNATAHERFRRKGYTAAVYALMWQGSASQHWSRLGGEPLRSYALFERNLT